MHSFCVEIITQTASFRNPEFQNFHKTLDLPPPTTVIGLAGAALGLSPPMAQDFFEQAEFQVGIAGQTQGRMRDTWKYNKRTKGMHMYHPLLDGSVIQREHLVNNRFVLVFCSENIVLLEKLKTAFEYPVFALTMGNSDALAMVKTVNGELEITESDKLKHCIAEGDIIGEVLKNASENFKFSIYQSSESIRFDLPTRFEYKSDYGKRTVSNSSTFTFVGEEMQLNYKVKGVHFQNFFIPIFSL